MSRTPTTRRAWRHPSSGRRGRFCLNPVFLSIALDAFSMDSFASFASFAVRLSFVSFASFAVKLLYIVQHGVGFAFIA